jgi:hypothetical protein
MFNFSAVDIFNYCPKTVHLTAFLVVIQTSLAMAGKGGFISLMRYGGPNVLGTYSIV